MSVKKSNIKPTQAAEPARATVTKQVIATATFEGPVPHPDLLAKYEQILPGAAERIVKMAETEQQIRHDSVKADMKNKSELIEAAQLESASNRNAVTRGQWIGATISLACILAAAYFAWLGKSEIIVCAFLAVPTASLIAAFFPSQKDKRKEEQK